MAASDDIASVWWFQLRALNGWNQGSFIVL